MPKKLRSLWDLTRLSLGILAGISAIEGALFSALLLNTKENFLTLISNNISLFLLGFFIPMAIVSAAMALNDYYDYPIDLKNRRMDRPLVRGDLSTKDVKYIVLLLYGLGIIASLLFLDAIITLLVSLFVLLSIFYSYQSSNGNHILNLKKRGLIGNIVVSSSYLAPFFIGSLFWVIHKKMLPSISWLGATILFIFGTLNGTLGREILKGLLDIQGDVAHGIKTIAASKGEMKAKIMGSTFITIGLLSFYLLIVLTFKTTLSFITSVIFLALATISYLKTLDIIFRTGMQNQYHGLREVTRAALWFITLSLLFGILLEGIS